MAIFYECCHAPCILRLQPCFHLHLEIDTMSMPDYSEPTNIQRNWSSAAIEAMARLNYSRLFNMCITGPCSLHLLCTLLTCMRRAIEAPVKLVHYADDSFLFVGFKTIESGFKEFENRVEKKIEVFLPKSLTGHKCRLNRISTFLRHWKTVSINNIKLRITKHVIVLKNVTSLEVF